MTWTAPRRGIRSNGACANPLMPYWANVKPPKGKFRFLPPFISPKWEVELNKHGPSGVIGASLTRLETQLGLIRKITLHITRNWFPTYAKQLSFSKEYRTALGRWNPGSNMPDRYDRSVCATELALRDNIVTRIEKGRGPAPPYEIPSKSNTKARDLADCSAESTSESPTMSEFARAKEDISDLYGNGPAISKKE